MKVIKIFAIEPNFKVRGIRVQPITCFEYNNALVAIREYSKSEPSDKCYSAHKCLFRVQRYLVDESYAEFGTIKNNGNQSCGIVLHFNEGQKDSLEQKLDLHKN